MSAFDLQLEQSCLRLTLTGDVTIEHARALADALLAQLNSQLTLAVDAAGLTRLDAAILQVLLASASRAADTRLEKASPAWAAAFSRYAAPDPFHNN